MTVGADSQYLLVGPNGSEADFPQDAVDNRVELLSAAVRNAGAMPAIGEYQVVVNEGSARHVLCCLAYYPGGAWGILFTQNTDTLTLDPKDANLYGAYLRHLWGESADAFHLCWTGSQILGLFTEVISIEDQTLGRQLLSIDISKRFTQLPWIDTTTEIGSTLLVSAVDQFECLMLAREIAAAWVDCAGQQLYINETTTIYELNAHNQRAARVELMRRFIQQPQLGKLLNEPKSSYADQFMSALHQTLQQARGYKLSTNTMLRAIATQDVLRVLINSAEGEVQPILTSLLQLDQKDYMELVDIISPILRNQENTISPVGMTHS